MTASKRLWQMRKPNATFSRVKVAFGTPKRGIYDLPVHRVQCKNYDTT